MNRLFTFICLLFSLNYIQAQSQELEKRVQSVIGGKNATIGVSVIYDNQEILSVNNEQPYPLMSVFKFPLALAVLDNLKKNGLSPETTVFIRRSDLLQNTYSPLRDKHPQGELDMSINELLKYSVSISDNNACDILLHYIGGTQVLEDYIKSLGIDMTIAATEKEMNENTASPYSNHSTPVSAVRLMELFLEGKLLPDAFNKSLENILTETSTGSDKLKGLLSQEVVVGHKTGSSPRTEAGLKIGDNDMGFVRLPNGEHYSIAVFVKESMESDAVNARIIAEISKAVYDYMLKISKVTPA